MTDQAERTAEQVSALNEAQDLIGQAIDILTDVADQNDDGSHKTYMIATLEVMVGRGGWMSHDQTIEQWIGQLENGNEEDEEEED